MAVGGVILLIGAVLTASDPVGLLLMGLAGLLLLGFSAYAFVMRPRLAVSFDDTTTGEGTFGGQPTLTMRTLGGTHTYPADRIDRIRVLDFRRIGRRTGQLEIDVLTEGAPTHADGDGPREDTRLLVFSRWDLGADLGEVAEDLRRAGFTVEDRRR
ncbi:hypothetical protein GORHZ_167_00200 [Gordonia rhizosphera NBRC 16068]|uniref:Low molecular weight protein antigen 6 PH domain-containing protein n=2 Tax=Gordonia rhizosphera TaxID=83341 RepID=K6WEM9_9ACTN|nr:hypothetical protein GORHZ_167_00200 [Gordonia rhizosphera NBRC 16068]